MLIQCLKYLYADCKLTRHPRLEKLEQPIHLVQLKEQVESERLD